MKVVLRLAKVRVAEESRAQAGGGLEELGGSEGESESSEEELQASSPKAMFDESEGDGASLMSTQVEAGVKESLELLQRSLLYQEWN